MHVQLCIDIELKPPTYVVQYTVSFIYALSYLIICMKPITNVIFTCNAPKCIQLCYFNLFSARQFHTCQGENPGIGVTLYQGASLVEVAKARVERHICTSFPWGSGHAHPENF
jgi:hypothetical protein